ncbi:hypothetical protein SCACP_40270 [Sporomusa carbonis]|uniref:hypothetical protein n=1 Tax=Sporomusa carbonis TaxID=3076075 RepID=UPI003A6EA124
MKKLIAGMFSSVPDAELFTALGGQFDPVPENVTDTFSNDSLARGEANSPMASTTTNETSSPDSINKEIDNSLE